MKFRAKGAVRWSALLCVTGASGCAARGPVAVAVAPTAKVAATPQVTATPQVAATPRKPTRKVASKPRQDVRAVAFSADRKWFAVGAIQRANADGSTISMRDCATNRIVKTWNFAGITRFLAFAPNGESLAAVAGTTKLLVWNWKSGRRLHSSAIQGGAGNDGRIPIAFAPDGRTIAIGVGNIQLLDTRTWKVRQTLSGRSSDQRHSVETIGQIGFSPNGKWILTSDGFEGYSGYNLYPVPSGRARHIVDGGPSQAMTFSRDGNYWRAMER